MSTISDFDDGGTPGWRARYAATNPKKYSPWRWVLAFLTLILLLPWVILFSGLGAITLWHVVFD